MTRGAPVDSTTPVADRSSGGSRSCRRERGNAETDRARTSCEASGEAAQWQDRPVLIDIVAYDGLDEMDALGPLEVLRSAAQLGAAFTVRLTTRQEQREVAGAYGLRFVPDTVFEPGVADVLIVPGGGGGGK